MAEPGSSSGSAAGGGGGVSDEEVAAALGECSLTGSWVFSVAGAALAVPLGIRARSLSPLVFLGTSGAMLDILQGFAACERDRAAVRQRLEQRAVTTDEPR
eukprot:SM000004S15049  [mRNA]  locus=s4:1044654:1044956:+ [translate_table: standard]